MSNTCESEKWAPAFHVNDKGDFIIDDSIMRKNNEAVSISTNTYKVLSLIDVVTIVASYLGTNILELKSLSRERSLSYKRALVTFFCLRYSSATITEISCFFNRNVTNMQELHIKIKSNIESYIDKKTLLDVNNLLKSKAKKVE